MNPRVLMVGLVLMAGVGLEVLPALGGHESISDLLPGNPVEGSRFFTEKGCLRCHAVHGTGGVAGPDLGRGTLRHPLLEMAGEMWNHAPGMDRLFQQRPTVRPQFESSEMASLLAFLYYLGSLDPPGDAAVGARLFRQKGCQPCHSLGGKGGSIGPKLDKYSRYASPLYLTAALWNRGQAMAEKTQEMGMSRPIFEGNDLPDLLAYIRSVGQGLERVYATPGSPERGKELFIEKRCAECHAIRGHGGRVGPDLGITLKGSLMRIAGTIWNHGPRMWGKMAERGIDVPSFSTEEMADLISYLYFLQFSDPPADVERGRLVYQEKRCGTCHALRGVGKEVGPDLAQVEELSSPLEVITEMWNHAPKMEGKMLEENVAWPVLKGGETADLIAYLLAVREGSATPVEAQGAKPGGKQR